MCGRFALFADDDDLVPLFDIDLVEGEHAPTWNQAPSQQIRVVMEPLARGARVQRKMRLLEWGLVPGWARTPARPMINARAETLAEKPSFRAAAARRRCLVPANGYFEWQAPAPGAGSRAKQPWFLSAAGRAVAGAGNGDEADPVLAFAGIYDAWRAPDSGPDDGWLLTCAIVTRAATDALGMIHDRMPVVVPPGLWDAWLDPTMTDLDRVGDLLRSIPDPGLVPRRVGRAVGSVRNDSPDLVAPLPGPGDSTDGVEVSGEGQPWPSSGPSPSDR